MDAQDPTPESAPRRRAPRASVVLQLAYRSASHLLVSYCTNLSRGGLFVPSQEPLPPGTHLSLSLTIPGDAEPIELHAEVRWVRQFDALEGPAGMGLAFEDIDEVLGDRVDAIVAQFVPLRVALVGDHGATLGHVASIVRTLVSCATDEQSIAEADADEVAASDLVVVEIGADAEPALALLRRIGARPHAPPRIALCDGRSDVRARCISLCRIVGTPIDPGELREAVLDSVAQVDARRRAP
ncbi:MAG: TIGR02266 family protein [Myxococcales bacterium]|nr:TIGR02266 family protein [Myxococcales bacterium]